MATRWNSTDSSFGPPSRFTEGPNLGPRAILSSSFSRPRPKECLGRSPRNGRSCAMVGQPTVWFECGWGSIPERWLGQETSTSGWWCTKPHALPARPTGARLSFRKQRRTRARFRLVRRCGPLALIDSKTSTTRCASCSSAMKTFRRSSLLFDPWRRRPAACHRSLPTSWDEPTRSMSWPHSSVHRDCSRSPGRQEWVRRGWRSSSGAASR
jgi:hypothetical protein